MAKYIQGKDFKWTGRTNNTMLRINVFTVRPLY